MANATNGREHRGDELVVLSAGLTASTGAQGLGERLQSAFADPFVIDGRRIDIGASVGVTDTRLSTNAGDLLRFADTALYHCKESGGRKFKVFDDQLHRDLRRRIETEQNLLPALNGGRLVPYLQPLVEMVTGRIVGAEALIRWEAPGEVRPGGEFLPVASDIGLLPDITRLVMSEIADYRFLLNRHGGQDISIVVNVARPNLEGLLLDFEGTGVLNGMTIEITEESSFRSLRRAQQLIDRLHTEGAYVLLDDFGVGLSSLSRAVDLHVDGYKLDKTFIAPLAGSTHAAAVIAASWR